MGQILLKTLSEYLHGQLEGYVIAPVSSLREREQQLGDFLCYLNTLLASSGAMFASVSSNRWATLLLKCVDVDRDTGIHVVC